MKDLNVKAIIIKPLEENTEKSFMFLDLAMISWIWYKKHKQQKKKTDKLDYIKI